MNRPSTASLESGGDVVVEEWAHDIVQIANGCGPGQHVVQLRGGLAALEHGAHHTAHLRGGETRVRG